MKKYRVFSQDINPPRTIRLKGGLFTTMGTPGVTEPGYSGVKDVMADCPLAAVSQVTPAWKGEKMIALPHDRKDLWPHKTTGAVTQEALDIQREVVSA